MIEEGSWRRCNESILVSGSVSDRTLSDHWDSIHMWCSFLLHSMPVYSHILIRDFVLDFNDDDVIYTDVYWWPRCHPIDSNCRFTVFLDCWFDYETVMAPSWFHVEFARTITRRVCGMIVFVKKIWEIKLCFIKLKWIKVGRYHTIEKANKIRQQLTRESIKRVQLTRKGNF